MQIGNQKIDKKLVADSFRASSSTYEEKAVVQKLISRQLVTYLGAIALKNFSTALEIGCCTGYLTEHLIQRFGIKRMYINDLVEEFCSQTYERIERSSHVMFKQDLLVGDIEELTLPKGLDLIVSSSTLQWIVDLNRLIRRISVSLNPGGYLAFTIFAPGTMGEISSLTGRGLVYKDQDQLKQILQDYMNIELFTEDTHTLYFPSVRAVLRHIKQTGVGGIGRSRWTKSSLVEFEDRYRQKYETEKGLPITYCSNYVVAKKI